MEECRCIRRGVSRLAPLLNMRSPALLFHLVAVHACHAAPFGEDPMKMDSNDPPVDLIASIMNRRLLLVF